jgi:poly(hydroxyalkanoate) depolymerase family esterase
MKTNQHRVVQAMAWFKRGLSSLATVPCSLATKFLAVVVMVSALLLMPAPVWALTEVPEFGSNPGNLRMYQYVPPNLPSSAPLVVALHGCLQTAKNYDDETGWVKLAKQNHFALLLPEQQKINNVLSCFNWFSQTDIHRGTGEALSIKQMIDKMKTDYNLATDRVYVTGLSAGGGMTSVMLATYPEIFAGGAIIAGVPYDCAHNVIDAPICMNPGKHFTSREWGDKVRASANYKGPWPIVSIWQGGKDPTVNASNLTEHLKQWTNVHGIDRTPDREEMVSGYPHRVYQDDRGRDRIETYEITDMSHGTPINPGFGEKHCGKAAPFILDKNICSSYYISQFWGLMPKS